MCRLQAVQHQTAEIYDGLVNIMERLNKYDIDIIINGGNDFVSKLILNGKYELIDGINQEGVPKVMQPEEGPLFPISFTKSIVIAHYVCELLS